MEEDEDYEGLFFTECQELLASLQEHLNLLAEGGGDDETVNAAFRSVHSVKGGAAAFGFNDLIAFAHVFETVMDRIRSHQLELSEEVGHVLLRAGDVMEMLIEKARERAEPPRENMERVQRDLEHLAGLPSSEPKSSAAEASPVDDAPADAATGSPDVDQSDTSYHQYVFAYRPGPEHFNSGHDPVKVIRAARAFDLTEVSVSGDIPTLADLDPQLCPLEWTLTFETDRTHDELSGFFEMYRLSADIILISIDGEPVEVSTASGVDAAGKANGSAAALPVDYAGHAATSDTPKRNGTAEADRLQDRTGPALTSSSSAVNEEASRGGKPSDGSAAAKLAASKSLRVDLTRIDRLVNLVGEMLITQAGLAQRIAERDGDDSLEVSHSVEAMSRQLRELQESVMAIRAQPVKAVFSRMPRVVRDLAEKLGKDVKLELSGEHTEVDTTVIEELAEPLTHMLRNSMDHGIEDAEGRAAAGKPRTGTIRLSAEHRGERVIITVADDGRGVNREKVLRKAIEKNLVSPDDSLSPDEIDQLIFHPGFSTADTISSVSGRGVGMDVVKKKIQSLGGRCTLRNMPGKGTEFIITLPLTLAVMDGMTIRVGGQQFILPLSCVVEALRIDDCTIRRLPDSSSLLERRGEYLRLINLSASLNMSGGNGKDDMAIVVDTETIGLVALRVDDLIGQRQVVLKSLEANFKRVDGIAGATILGDGHVALILDVPSLISMGMTDYQPQEIFH
jgi:two-component system chemotaxis sensor kinase CheA